MKTKALETKSGLQINTLIDDLKNEDIRKRLQSVKNLNEIAKALGPERTRSELIPFINELMEDEDEVLQELIESLSNFVEYIGGAQYATCLIAPVEQLCKVEESSVRDQASKTLKDIIGYVDIKKNEEMLIALVKRLFEGGYYMSKSACALIIPSIYVQVNSTLQAELMGIYLKIAADEIPMVRKFASMHFKEYVKIYPTITEEQITSLTFQMLKDDQDFIRLYVVDAIIQMLQTQLNTKINIIIDYLKTLCEDNSWRIKYYVCDKLSDLVKHLGKDNFKKYLFSYYLKYLQDTEPELRSIAASKLDIAGSALDVDEILQKVLPIVKTLSTDTQNYVRTSLASSFLALCSVVGKKHTSDIILPIFLQLLKDEDSDVRINLFKKLNEITKVLGVDTLSQSIIPALTELAVDKNWRIRQSSIEIISFFAKEIGQEFLNEKIIKILMDWIQDRVYSVREEAMKCVKNLVQYLGADWAQKNVMPKILLLQNVPNYLHRMTVLFHIGNIAKQLTPEFMNKTILPVIVSLSKDPVPNVRMNVAKTIKVSQSAIKEKETIKKILQTLNEDLDIDVKYHAKIALDDFTNQSQ